MQYDANADTNDFAFRVDCGYTVALLKRGLVLVHHWTVGQVHPHRPGYQCLNFDWVSGEILVYARALPALPALHALPAIHALPYCFNRLPFIDGALQIWVALPVSKSHLLIVVMYDFHFYFWFISWLLTVIEDGACCKWMERQEIQQHHCSWWGD